MSARAEARRRARALGWRGAKAKRLRQEPTILQHAFRQAVRERLEALEAQAPEEAQP